MQVKYFEINDEPNAPALKESEVAPLRQGLQRVKSVQDMKHADMLMEKSMNQKKQQEQVK